MQGSFWHLFCCWLSRCCALRPHYFCRLTIASKTKEIYTKIYTLLQLVEMLLLHVVPLLVAPLLLQLTFLLRLLLLVSCCCFFCPCFCPYIFSLSPVTWASLLYLTSILVDVLCASGVPTFTVIYSHWRPSCFWSCCQGKCCCWNS